MARIILPRNFKGIIFDKDGVLFNTEPIKAESWRVALADYGYDNGDKFYLENVGNSREYFEAKVSEIFTRVRDIKELRTRRKAAYKEAISRGVPPIDSSLRFLKSIPKVKYFIGLASSDPREMIETQLRAHQIHGLFDAISSREEVKYDKPNPEIYIRTAEKMGLSPSDCVGIEDSVPGMTAVRRAGICGVGLVSSASNRKALELVADVLTDDLTKIVLNIG